MSFDVFLQGFAGGEAQPGRPDAVTRVLAPYFAEARRDGYVRLKLADGKADVYGVGRSSIMVNHASGEQIWDLIVTVAAAAGWVIMPVGCPVCVLVPVQAADLPDELLAGVTVVRTGTELRQVIRRHRLIRDVQVTAHCRRQIRMPTAKRRGWVACSSPFGDDGAPRDGLGVCSRDVLAVG